MEKVSTQKSYLIYQSYQSGIETTVNLTPGTGIGAINRTKVELKPKNQPIVVYRCNTINRTKVELKRTPKPVQLTSLKLSIVPKWN